MKIASLPVGGKTNPSEAKIYVNETIFDDGIALETPRFDRTKLLAKDKIIGPAIISQHNSTTIVPPGYTARVLGHGDIQVTRD